jgi:hypothetical protein
MVKNGHEIKVRNRIHEISRFLTNKSPIRRGDKRKIKSESP